MGNLVLYVLGSAVRAEGSDLQQGCCVQGQVLYSGESRHAGSSGYRECVCTREIWNVCVLRGYVRDARRRGGRQEISKGGRESRNPRITRTRLR